MLSDSDKTVTYLHLQTDWSACCSSITIIVKNTTRSIPEDQYLHEAAERFGRKATNAFHLIEFLIREPQSKILPGTPYEKRGWHIYSLSHTNCLHLPFTG